MRKIISNFFMSLDGVVEAPETWHFDYFNDEMGAAIGAGAATADSWLMGRKLYDSWSAYWPQQPDDVPFSSFINGVQKYVVSDTLSEATWANSQVISGDVAAQLTALKQGPGQDITMSGSATLVRWLLSAGLLDELHLLIHPVAVGSGQRLFEDAVKHPLRLIDSATFTTGVLNVSYAAA